MASGETAEYIRSLEARICDMECALRRVDAALRHIGGVHGIFSGNTSYQNSNPRYFGRGGGRPRNHYPRDRERGRRDAR